MDIALLSLAFTSGVLIFFTPCGVALLPAYVTYILGGQQAQKLTVRQKAWVGFKVGSVVSLGIVSVFVAAAALVAAFGNFLAPHARTIAIVVGGLLVVLGILMLAGKSVSVTIPHSLKADKRTTGRFFLFGVGYALGGIGCTLPAFLFIIFSGLSSGSWQAALLIFLVFASGTVLLMLGVTTISAVSAQLASAFISKYMPIINRAAGAVIVLAGIYLIFFQFGVTLATLGSAEFDMAEEPSFSVYAGTDHTVTLERGGSITLLPQSIQRDPDTVISRYLWGVAQAPAGAQFALGDTIYDGDSADPYTIKFSAEDVGLWRFALRVEDSRGVAAEDEFRVLVQRRMESLDRVIKVSGHERLDLYDEDEVIGVVANGTAMAYPRKTMNYYGIANDVVGDTPVVIVFCDSCATGIAYSRALPSGEVVLFKGLGGTLSEDRYQAVDQNKRFWSVIDGSVSKKPETQLEFVDFEQTSWRAWLAKYSNTLVMAGSQQP